ncbi:SDR family oxidoreductase [Nocardioides sp. InS609-2]|uniref:SDR family oxidoreductase n=1 Tax=Nocardioides sp. InS609-2 TaxID=2760705 RepID=UPI0020BDD498|nr:SDR family oxidoreductase [Nocardioides sp. InS609-2]
MNGLTSPGRVLIIGPHGVVGGAVKQRLNGNAAWDLATASRRPAEPGQTSAVRAVSVDLLDTSTVAGSFVELADVTHVVFAGYTERPTMAEMVEPNVAMLRNTLDGLIAAGARLEHVVLIGGGKSYGEHLGAYKTPAKETDPRFLGRIFYNDQEDLLHEMSSRQGFTWTVLRPDLVLGFALGSPMNMLMALGVYASLCKDAGVPLRFPGTPTAWTALHQFTDADVLAAAVEWALDSPNAVGEVFNVTNGDNFRWQHLWDDMAGVFDMPTAAPQPMSLTEQMADKGHVWDALVHRHRLVVTTYDQVSAWRFADAVLATDFDMVQSTIKIRQAGFHGCVDTHTSVVGHLQRLREHRYLP